MIITESERKLLIELLSLSGKGASVYEIQNLFAKNTVQMSDTQFTILKGEGKISKYSGDLIFPVEKTIDYFIKKLEG